MKDPKKVPLRVIAGILMSLLIVGCGGSAKPKLSQKGESASQTRQNIANDISKNRKASERAADYARRSNFANSNEFADGDSASTEEYKNPGNSGSKNKNDLFMALGALVGVKLAMSAVAPNLKVSGNVPKTSSQAAAQSGGASATFASGQSIGVASTTPAPKVDLTQTSSGSTYLVQVPGASGLKLNVESPTPDEPKNAANDPKNCPPQPEVSNQATELQSEVTKLLEAAVEKTSGQNIDLALEAKPEPKSDPKPEPRVETPTSEVETGVNQ